MKQLKFSGRIKSRPVDINGVLYELREMKAAARDRYMDKLSQRLKVNPKGDIIGINKFDGMQIDLLTQCLFDPEGKAVTDVILKEWPSGDVQGMFQAAQEINHLRKPDERNRIVAEQIVKLLSKQEGGFLSVTATMIEEVIEDADRNLFFEKEDVAAD